MANPTPTQDAKSEVPLLKIMVFAVKTYYKISPRYTVFSLFETLFNGLTSTINALITAFMLDQAVKMAQAGKVDQDTLLHVVLLLLGFSVLRKIITFLSSYLTTMRNYYAQPRLMEMNYTKLLNLGIETLEDPEVQNLQNRVTENIGSIDNYFFSMLYFLQSCVTLVTTGIALIGFFPLGIILVTVVSLPGLLIDRRYRKRNWKLYLDNTEYRRKGSANSTPLTDLVKLPEIIITAADKYLLSKYHKFIEEWTAIHDKMFLHWYTFSFVADNFRDLGLFIGYALIIVQFVQKFASGVIGLGTLTFQKSMIDNFGNSLDAVLTRIGLLIESKRQVAYFYELMQLQPNQKDGDTELPRLADGPSIQINNLTFHYPNSKVMVFENLNLEIKSGEKIAIVGHNGAGKTTLVKLISRLYRPQGGEILVNGNNLNEIKANDWYKNIGVLFQDYNTYDHLTAEENIYLGRSAKSLDETRVKEAAEAADADSFIQELPDKYNQTLSEKYKGGHRPSTGQWQKIAIARFFYRNAPLVIFDEPTAAIDAVSEYKIFNKIYDFFKGKTVIIISHRFSTVRNADRIIVMDKGKIVEEGTHQQLMEMNGTYATAFRLQAEGYQH